MKFSIQFLIPLLYAISAANAFVAPGARPFAIQQRQGLFAEKNDYLETLSSGVTATEEKAPEKAAEKVEEEEEEELSETQKLMKQVKEAGTAGVISYALWELGFWALSVRFNLSTKSLFKDYTFGNAPIYSIATDTVFFCFVFKQVPVCAVGYYQVSII